MRRITGLKTLIAAGAVLAVTAACGTPVDSSSATTSASSVSFSVSTPSVVTQSPTTPTQAADAMAQSEPAVTAAPQPPPVAISPPPPPAEPATPEPPPAEPATAEPATAEPAPEPVAPDIVIPDVLQFTATTLDGAEFSGASLAGSPAVLWFWAPWCPNCRAEAPQVAAAAAATDGQVTFIGVAAQDDLPPMQTFVDNYGVGGFEHLADLDAAIWQRFGVTYQPAYAFIGADGSVDVVKSRVSQSQLADKLAELTAS